MTIEEYWEQVCRLNGQINEKLLQATRLRGEGNLTAYAELEREIDRDIDALVDLKEDFCQHRHGKEAVS